MENNNSYRRLTRSTSDRRIAGVCGGIAKYLNIDPTVVRILFLISIFFGFIGVHLAYRVSSSSMGRSMTV